jgi:hypothetical protein
MVLHTRMEIILSLAIISLLDFGCSDEKSKKDSKEDDTATETDSNKGDASVPDDTDTAELDACQVFHDFLVDCDDMSAVEILVIEAYCEAFDDVFIDSLMDVMVPCMTEVGCEGFKEMLESAEDTDTTASDAQSAMETCALEAISDVEPEQANLDFQDHFCEYIMSCDEKMSEDDCKKTFVEDQNTLFFLVLEDTYVSDADDCVTNPVPGCSIEEVEEVNACLQAVGESVSGIFNDLM